MRILAICGSLRAQSSNRAALVAAARLAPAGLDLTVYEGLGGLPPFNPDLDTGDPPPAVQALRDEIGACDGLLICSPEYARGVAGAMKNALDWLVSSHEFPGMPVGLINTSPRATHADAQLRLTLCTMSARFIEEASIVLPLLGQGTDADAIVADPDLSGLLRTALHSLAHAIAAEPRLPA